MTASGRKDDRPEYRRMLDYVAQNDVDTVVVLFLDRFGRNPREILRRYWQLEERGVAVHSINEDLREELMLLLRAGIAGQESRRTSERVVMALREAAKRGKLVSKLPFGYIKIRDQATDRKYLAMRKVELGALDFQKAQYAAGSSLREIVNIKQGIDSDLGRKISKEIKSAKMKVQLAIQGNELRITGKKRDDLQEAIAFINGMKNSQPLQFVNFRD